MNKLLLLTLLLINTISFAQTNSTFYVVDKQNGDAIPYANISIQKVDGGTKTYTITNEKGAFQLPGSEKVEITVSYVGYKTYTNIVDPSELKKIELEPDVFSLEQIVVTGQNKPMLRDSSIYSIKVFDSKLIQQRGAINLADVLKAQPSIKIKQSGSYGSNISILGLGGENVKIMIDGVPIIGRLDGNLDLSQITMENVDHIEVVEGPMSVVYGSNALAGTVNIITKNNKWNSAELVASTYAESPGTFNANLYGSLKKANNIYTISGARNYFAGTSYDNTRASKWKGSEQYIGELRYAYQAKKATLRFNAKYFDEFMKDKGAVYGAGTPTPYAFDVNFLTKRYSLNGFMEYEHNKKMQTNIQSSISYYDRVMQTVRTDMTNLREVQADSDTTTFVNFMTRATFNHTINSKISYQTGIDLNTEKGSAKRIANGTQSISDYALFITGKHEFWKGFLVQPGIRYAYNTKFNSPLLYSVNLKVNIIKNVQVRASFAKGFRAPTLKELYLDFSHAGYDIRGNSDLQPEYSHTLNGSLIYNYKNDNKFLFNMELKGYYNNIKDKIDFALVGQTGNTQTWMNINRGNVETKGWIADATFDVNSRWSFNTNYTRSGITSLLYENDNSKDKFIFSDNFLASVTYKNPTYDYSARIEYAYKGKEPVDFLEENNLSQFYIESYNDLNITLTKSFWERRLNVSLGAKNLFDNQDLAIIEILQDGGTAPSPEQQLLSWGRSYFVKIILTLNKH